MKVIIDSCWVLSGKIHHTKEVSSSEERDIVWDDGVQPLLYPKTSKDDLSINIMNALPYQTHTEVG